MKIHHLNCGSMCPYGGRFVSGNQEKPKMVCHCLLVETPTGLVLIDTGLGTPDIHKPWKHLGGGFVLGMRPALDPNETARAQVLRLGYSPADVRDIVVTHLDVDHAGGIPDFPNATVHVYATEHEAAKHRTTLREQLRYRPHQFTNHTLWNLLTSDGERWYGFEKVRAIHNESTEILLVPLIGHTRGHCAVAVRTQSGWLVHAGDAFFHHDEVHGDFYRCPPFLSFFQRHVAMDRHSMENNRMRLRELVQSNGGSVAVFCAHDPNEFERLKAGGRP